LVAVIEKVGDQFLVLAFQMIVTEKRRRESRLKNNKDWVDFKSIKAAVTLQMVLKHYKVSGLEREGDEFERALSDTSSRNRGRGSQL
jgi:hypothetical protein